LARLTSLTTLARTKGMQYIVDRAIFFTMCPQLTSIVQSDARCYYDPSPKLAKAMAKGQLPSWKTLDFCSDGGASDLV
jgi:hypothetical protein